MISRVAEHCYWMGRYLERAENTARILEVNQTLLLDFPIPVEQQWAPLLIISGIHDFEGKTDGEAVQNHMTWELDNLASIASSIGAARENARNIREVISAETWERLNYYYLWIHGPGAHDLYRSNRSEFYNRVKRINQMIHGIVEGTMSHGEAWEFYRLGTYLERACQTARILDVKYHVLLPTPDQVGTPIDNAQWVAILMSCSGYEPFHKQRPGTDPGVSVADFLIFDNIFPRSVRFCLHECRRAIHAISGRPISQPTNETEHQIGLLSSWIDLIKIDDVVMSGLHEVLTDVVDQIHALGESIDSEYFNPDRKPTERQRPAAAGEPSQAQTQDSTASTPH